MAGKYLLLSPLRRVHDLNPETLATEVARDVDGFAWAVPAVVGRGSRAGFVYTRELGRIVHDPKHQQFASRAFMASLQNAGVFERGDDGIVFGDFDAVRVAWTVAKGAGLLGTHLTRR